MDEIIETLLLAVEEQAQAEETVYVRETLDRLVEEHDDVDEAEAKKLVAFCLADEMEGMMVEGREFDEGRYRMLLGLLPTMPEGK